MVYNAVYMQWSVCIQQILLLLPLAMKKLKTREFKSSKQKDRLKHREKEQREQTNVFGRWAA